MLIWRNFGRARKHLILRPKSPYFGRGKRSWPNCEPSIHLGANPSATPTHLNQNQFFLYFATWELSLHQGRQSRLGVGFEGRRIAELVGVGVSLGADLHCEVDVLALCKCNDNGTNAHHSKPIKKPHFVPVPARWA